MVFELDCVDRERFRVPESDRSYLDGAEVWFIKIEAETQLTISSSQDIETGKLLFKVFDEE